MRISSDLPLGMLKYLKRGDLYCFFGFPNLIHHRFSLENRQKNEWTRFLQEASLAMVPDGDEVPGLDYWGDAECVGRAHERVKMKMGEPMEDCQYYTADDIGA